MLIIIPHLTLCRGPRSLSLASPSVSETYLILPIKHKRQLSVCSHWINFCTCYVFADETSSNNIIASQSDSIRLPSAHSPF